ncbi:type I restriction endonuclease subunit R [Bilifractor sp. LCP19S3_H10]|uniref:type I restriction endonuclease subunit R n=1 Tax=Bilifractor sp. LCP19S3_H10 TaxID=3438736 RepID=UPI003F9152C0
MAYDYSENKLVQDSSAALLHDELGWDTVFAYDKEVLGENGTLGRKSYHDILLYRDITAALKRLNPWITDQQIKEAEDKLSSHLSTSSLLQINEEKYFMLRNGIRVTVKRPDGKLDSKLATVIDFSNPDNNRFLAVQELKIYGDLYRRRTDIVGFVNGIPLMFIELKRTDVDVEVAYNKNYTDYLDTIPHLFYYNAFLILANGPEAKVGTLGSKYEFFSEWKRLKEGDKGNVALETMLRGICRKDNFLDLFENFILFDHSSGKTAKILARNHQYLGVNEAVQAYADRKLRNGKLGVFWHTQGSGKSYSMVFLAQKIRRKFQGSPTIVVLTDRDELNRQISGTFEGCGLLGKAKASEYIATSGDDLINKLKGNPSFIFTLIQKFNKPDAKPIKVDHDILIMSDEAHRSQYGIFANNMDRLLPDASKIGFTGTPLLADDNITERTFGGYVSIYDFKRAVEDGATVPLYYENRGERLQVNQDDMLTDKILDAVERADLDPEQEEKLEHEFEKEIHVLTAEPRLRRIAKDFVGHYSDLWTSGKAMFVCLNKVTCVRMYNYVQEYWKKEICALEEREKTLTQQESEELQKKINWMKQTEMCVVISQEQNEIKTFQKWGLDIKPHREKMEKRELDKEFKDPANPFRVVFVCAMWLTGFDVKCLSCLYLDKPMKAHTLMQTIARANRVAEGKENGLIIDYIGIVGALRKALAAYTANPSGRGGSDPTIDKEKLVEKIAEAITKGRALLKENNFDLENLIAAKNFNKMSLLLYAANAMCGDQKIKKTFTTYADEVRRLLKYLDRDDISDHLREEAEALIAILNQIYKKRAHVDNTDLMVEIDRIISEYISVEDAAGPNDLIPSKRFDISKIDFNLLSTEFEKAKNQNLLLRDLEEIVYDRIQKMLAVNPRRIDYLKRYQEIIDNYNQEQDKAAIEKTFMDLMNFAGSMSTEQRRYVREGFENDEQLSIYDLLFRDDLSKEEIKKIKKVSIDLLAKIKKKIAELDHWTDKQETRAAVDILIRDTLWEELPDSYDDSRIREYRNRIYEYVYTHYPEVSVVA